MHPPLASVGWKSKYSVVHSTLGWRRGWRCRVWTRWERFRSRSWGWRGETKGTKRSAERREGGEIGGLLQRSCHSCYCSFRMSGDPSQICWGGWGTTLVYYPCVNKPLFLFLVINHHHRPQDNELIEAFAVKGYVLLGLDGTWFNTSVWLCVPQEPEWDVSSAFVANAASHIKPKGSSRKSKENKENEARREVIEC